MKIECSVACALMVLCTLALAACGSGSGTGGPMGNTEPPLPPPSIGADATSGFVYGGQSPVVDSTVTLYAAGVGTPAAQVGNPVRTDTSGHWSIAYNCPIGDPWLYAVARGGNPGLSNGTNNTALALVAMLGRCNTAPSQININELTTVAAAYALRVFIGGTNPLDISSTPTNAVGLDNAMTMSATLADVVSGSDGSTLPSTANSATQQKFNSLGNALAACVNTASGASSQCQALFACATSGATYNGQTGSGADCMAGSSTNIPTDTLAAALAIADHPGTVSMSGVYATATRNAVFSPTLSAAPNDWTLALSFTNVGLSEPTGLALDADGNVWIANYNDRVVELGPTGTRLSPAGGYTGGGLHESFDLAIDASGHVWVANEESTGGFNSNHGSLTKLSGTGAALSGTQGYAGGGLDFPQAIAIDTSGNVWAVNAGNASVSEFSAAGTALSPTAGFTGGGISYPVGLAFDPSSDVWIANQAQNTISALQPTGAPLSPSGGYAATGLDVPQSVAVDDHGNVWVTNAYGSNVTEVDATGMALLTTTPFGSGGLDHPGGLAIDGAGRIWVANYGGASVTELAGADDTTPGTPLSPSTGFTNPNFSQPYAPAIDASGNVWVTNFGNDSVTVLVGAAAPVRMPRIGVAEVP